MENEKIDDELTYKIMLLNFGAGSPGIKRLRHPKNKMPNTIPSL